ncbi:MAG TPA: hypothetical protein PLN56_11155 [Methanoregulaceae archaeon]|nr:hypothetical protein [Methanoregulaceae archaeon]
MSATAVPAGVRAPEVRLAAKNESRLRALEGWRAEKAGEERRVSTIGAGAGGVVAVIVRVIGGG